MKSRIAITLILALGLLMTTTGAAVGIQSLSGPPSAAQEQYGQQQETPPNPRPDEDQGGSQPDGQESPDGETAPEGDTSPEAIGQPEAAPTGQDGVTQAPAQVAASNEGGNLPFTGFVAIPVLIAGLALLLTGVGMRRSTRRGSQE